MRKLPAVKQQIEKEIEKTKTDLRKDMLKAVPGEVNRTTLPDQPLSVKQACQT
jgi:hypothetical protein